jgi:hypothetical protein
MSINGQFRQISPRALEVVLQEPGLLAGALNWAPENPDPADPSAALPASARALLEMFPEAARANAVAQMLASTAALDQFYEEEFAALRAAGVGDGDLPPALDIRKSWEPLNHLLAGTPDEPGPAPLGSAVLGGREVGDDHVYGPIRVLTPAETADVAAALEALGDEGAMARYSPEAFDEAGLCGFEDWEDEEEAEILHDWVLETYREVRDYYLEARGRGYGMLLALV